MDSPIVRATLTAATLSGLSNFLAQCITCYRSNPLIQTVWDIPTSHFLRAVRTDFTPTDLIHFILFSLLACPPNYLWQCWLEAQFPAYTDKLSPAQKEKLVDDAFTGQSTGKDASSRSLRKRAANGTPEGAKTEKSTPANPAKAIEKAEKKLNLVNTGIKFSLDQTIGAAVNTVLFIAGIALLRGHGFESAKQDVREQFWPMISAGQKLWPAVSVLQFTVVPFEYRTLVGSFVGLVWGVLLSLMSSPGK